ncbi:MAG: MATE family efflux transporter [Desulfobacterales bacterium]|nr:MATE family efflux transporter [Desulfobacterales bacterium]
MNWFVNRWQGPGGYREVLRIAFPLVLSTGLTAIQYVVDRIFLARYSAEAIAAALPAGLLNWAVMSLFYGMAQYVNTFTAQYYGADRMHRIGPALWQGIYIGVFGGLFMLLLIPFSPFIYNLIGHDPLIRTFETEYFQILCMGGMPAMVSVAFSGFYTGRGNIWPVLGVSTLMTAANVILDYTMVFGNWGFPEMGIHGAGYATAIAALISCATYSFMTFSPGNNHRWKTLSGWRPDRKLFFRMIKYGFPYGVQMFMDLLGFTVFVLLVGRLGIVDLAATNIAFNINTLAFEPMLGAGMAASVLVGQYLGSDQPELAQRSAYSTFHICLLYMSIVSLSYVLVPDLYISLYASERNAENFNRMRDLVIVLLRFVAVYSLFDAICIIGGSVLNGAGDTRFVMKTNLLSSMLILVIPTYVAIVLLGYGLMTSWVLVTCYMIIISIIFSLRFLTGKWKDMRVIERQPPITIIDNDIEPLST